MVERISQHPVAGRIVRNRFKRITNESLYQQFARDLRRNTARSHVIGGLLVQLTDGSAMCAEHVVSKNF